METSGMESKMTSSQSAPRYPLIVPPKPRDGETLCLKLWMAMKRMPPSYRLLSVTPLQGQYKNRSFSSFTETERTASPHSGIWSRRLWEGMLHIPDSPLLKTTLELMPLEILQSLSVNEWRFLTKEAEAHSTLPL